MNLLWVTSYNSQYYDATTVNIIDTWKKLPGDIKFINDDIDKNNFLDCNFKKNNLSKIEVKFWKKSRSILNFLYSHKDYDFIVWLDADVEILQTPEVINILPESHQLLSANKKIPQNGTSLDTGFIAFNMKYKRLNEFLKIYETFWLTDNFEKLPFRYDAPALEYILKKNVFEWKNLWSEKITKGKSFCGFEDSELEKYFYHYWGKKKKNAEIGWKK